ncbi:MAG TPA: zf-HC2 domain-containing protein [Vicinamibacteria bacterium]|nr:zf-HC2 domain-containing protein [Vicinamibacteria bacterium]
MTCQELDARLDDWVDGLLPPREAAEVEAHLAGCAACREAERRLRRVVAHAGALPRAVTPPRDLWPGIQQRIAAPARWGWLSRWTSPLVLAAAAVGVLAVAAVVWQGRQPAGVQTAEIPAASPAPQPVSAEGGSLDPELEAAVRDYQAAANALFAALQQRQQSRAIAPSDLARVQANLLVIDKAIAEVRAALVRDPANPELNRMLVATHRKKVDVLRRVVRLSTAL